MAEESTTPDLEEQPVAAMSVAYNRRDYDMLSLRAVGLAE